MARLLRTFLQRIPPVQRQLKRIAELEAVVQLQQARLDALDRAFVAPVHAAIVGTQPATTAADEEQMLLDAIAARDREIRVLKVSYGSTFDELVAAGKAGGGTPYTFDELIAIRQQASAAPTAPPLVFLHVPKAGGTTLNNILMKNYRFRIDSYGDAFFPRYYPSEFVSLVQPPETDDTRRPVYFTGHINVDNDVFRYMPVRYVSITMLRDPVQRMVSHYRFHSTLNGSPFAAEINNGALGFVEYLERFRAEIPLQFDVFAPRRTGDEPSRVQEALRRLDSEVSFFGLQESYDGLVVQLQDLLGLPDVFYAPLNRTPTHAAPVDLREIEQGREILRHDVEFYEGAKKLYERRLQSLGPNFGSRLQAFGAAKQRYLELIGEGDGGGHAWRGYYAGLTSSNEKV